MGYYEDQLAAYQGKIKDLVDPGTVPTARKQISDRLSSVQSRFSGDVADILGGQLSGRDVASQYTRNFGQKNAQTVGQFDLNRRRTLMNQFYNYAFENYVQQGQSVRDADAAARQWAADQVAMKTQEESATKSRVDRRAEQDVRNQYQTAADNLKADYGNPYEQALMRSLFGLATTAATYKILAGKNKSPLATTSPSTPVAGENFGAFDPNEFFYDQFPYTRGGSRTFAGQ